MCQNTIFGSSGFSFPFLILKIQGSGFSFQFLNSKFQGSGFSFKFLKLYHNLKVYYSNFIFNVLGTIHWRHWQFLTPTPLRLATVDFRFRKLTFKSQFYALFDASSLSEFAKLNDFIWHQLIFSQKLFLFCIPPLKSPWLVLP